MSSEHIDQMLDRILGSHVAGNRRENRDDHHGMTEESPPHVACEKSDRASRRVAWQRHGGIAHLENRVGLFFANSPRRPDG